MLETSRIFLGTFPDDLGEFRTNLTGVGPLSIVAPLLYKCLLTIQCQTYSAMISLLTHVWWQSLYLPNSRTTINTGAQEGVEPHSDFPTHNSYLSLQQLTYKLLHKSESY